MWARWFPGKRSYSATLKHGNRGHNVVKASVRLLMVIILWLPTISYCHIQNFKSFHIQNFKSNGQQFELSVLDIAIIHNGWVYVNGKVNHNDSEIASRII